MAFSEGYDAIKSQLGLDIAQLILDSGDAGIWLWNVQTGETILMISGPILSVIHCKNYCQFQLKLGSALLTLTTYQNRNSY